MNKTTKHQVVAIMLTWPGHKFVITTRNARITQGPERFAELLRDMTMIVKRDSAEIWRETESLLTQAEKPLRFHYALFFKLSPMFSGERTIADTFKHGDFAKSILNLCKFGGDWMKSLSSQKRRQEAAEAYKAFCENHEIIITHE